MPAVGKLVAVGVLAAALLVTNSQTATAAATTTAWNGSFGLDRPNLIRRSDIVLGRPNTTPQASLPLGNGSLGVAAWAASGFTAQLNRSDTLPDRRSPGWLTIPGLAALTGAPDFAAHLDLYDGVLVESGGGLTARAYVRADADMLVVDVTGANPNATQTATVALWSPRNPAAQAATGVATLAETWSDANSGTTFGSLAAVTAGGRNVTASVADARTVTVTFQPNADGSFRVLAGAPVWTGGNAQATAAALFGSAATASAATLQAPSLTWWHGFWSTTNPMKLTSADGAGEYLENLRTFYLYQEAGLNRGPGNVPGSQAGVADMYSYNRDTHDWVPSDVWWWNARMQVTANLTSGAPALNTRWLNLYTSNLTSIQNWTAAHVPGRTGACVPETIRFNGNGYYGDGSSTNNDSCDTTTTPSYNSQNITTGAEVGLAIWQQYQATGDASLLSGGYPLMKAAAQFLLSYATLGGDGKLHETANAHETQWAVSDPASDVDAMKALFPAVRAAAQALGVDTAFQSQLATAIGHVRDWPRTDAATHTQVLTASADAAGQDVLAWSANPGATSHNTENVELEATYPYGLIGDNSPLTALAVRSYNARLYRNNADWNYDPLYAARLGLAAEVQAQLVATTQKYQLLPSGMASLFATASSNEPYDEQAGVVAATLNEALVQDYDNQLRVAPAWPSAWDVDAQVSVLHGSRVDVQVRGGVPSTVVLEAGASAAFPVRSPWPGLSVQVVDAVTGATVIAPTTAGSFTVNATAGHNYLIEQSASPFTNLPFAAVTGSPATAAKRLGPVSIGLAGGSEAPYGGVPAAVPGTIQAENYDTGGAGLAYQVSSVNGNGTAYRADGVDLESASEGGYDLGWTSGGQFFRYTVNVAAAGPYTLTARVAAPGAVANAFHFAGAGVSLPATGSWQTWVDVTTTVTLPAGRQVLTLAEDNGGWNVNYLRLSTAGGGGPTNLSAGKPTGESSHTDIYVSGHLTDGNPASYWESASNAFPQWAQVDLGSAQAAGRVVLQLPAGWGARTETITLAASTDGTGFTTVKASAGYTFDPVTGNTVTLTFTAATARYWRITISANTGWPAAQCSEMQIWSA